MIIFLDQTGELGGAEICLLDLVASRANSSQVILFSDGPLRERLVAASVPVIVLAGDSIDGIRRGSTLISAIRSLPAIIKLVLRVAVLARSAELLYANTQKAFVVAALAGFIARRRVIWHLHDILSSAHFSKAMRSVTVRLANRKASCVIANSNASADAFRQAGGTSPLRVVYNGIDSAPFDEVKQPTARAWLRQQLCVPEAPLLGVFGRLAEWKGQHILIDALKGIPDVHAVLVGGALFGETEYEERLRKQVAEAQLSERVHFLGFRDDVPAIMGGMDIIVHTSVAPEPFGRVIVEGMLACKPVIASRAGGVVEIVEDGVSGLLVTPGDASGLATAIRRLLDDNSLLERLAKHGRAEAIRRFSLTAYTSSIKNICEAVRDISCPSHEICFDTHRSQIRNFEGITAAVKPSVLFVDQTGELGGGELSLLDIAASRAKNSQVILFADGPFRERLAAAGVPVVILPGDAIFGIRRGSNILSAVGAIPALIALVWRVALHARSAEVIYANSQKAFVVAAIAGVLVRKPVVWHLRDILAATHFSTSMRAVTVRLANLKASCVIANSKASADAFRQSGGKAMLRVIYNGIASAPFDAIDPSMARAQLREELAISTAPLLGVFGRITEWKGQHILVDALRQVPDVHAVLVGSALFGESFYEDSLRRQVAEAGLAGRVHFLGFRDDIPSIMKGIDIVVHTSVSPEPFGRVIVEGMLAGKPVIATGAGGVVEIIQDGYTGLLVPPGDVSALSAAIRRLLNDRELAERLAKNGRTEALRKFSLQTCLASVERINQTVVYGAS